MRENVALKRVEQLGENLRENKINVEECYNYTQLIACRKVNRRSATQETEHSWNENHRIQWDKTEITYKKEKDI